MRTRLGLNAILTLSLSACVPSGTGGAATRAMAVAGGAVTVAGPQGYCIDGGASRDGASGAFVLLGSCASLTGSRAAGQPLRPAILTASASPSSGGGAEFTSALPGLAQFFQSAAGRTALSRTGQAETVKVERVSAAGGVLYIRLSDSAVAREQGVDATYWRALLAIGDQIVTLSVLSPRQGPLSSAEQRAVLDKFVARMRASNGAAARG
jgi:hypothetical protein